MVGEQAPDERARHQGQQGHRPDAHVVLYPHGEEDEPVGPGQPRGGLPERVVGVHAAGTDAVADEGEPNTGAVGGQHGGG